MDIVVGIIALNAFIFVLPYIYSFGPGGSSFLYFISQGWKSNSEISDGEYFRLLTATFLHGGFFHLFVNMYSLFQIGPIVLAAFKGPIWFSVIYLGSGIFGNLFSFFFNPSPSVGASGAIMGLMGSLFSYGVYTGNYSILSSIFLNLVIIALYGLSTSYIDNWGHFGGFIGGFLIAMILLYSGLVA